MDQRVIDLEEEVGAWYPDAVSVVPMALIAASVPRPTPVERVSSHLVILVRSGSVSHMVDYAEHPLSPLHAIHVRPGQVHQWAQSGHAVAGDVIVIRSSVVTAALYDRLLTVTAVPLQGDDLAAVLLAAELIRHECASGRMRGDHEPVLTAAATALLEALVRAGDEPGRRPAPARLIRDFRRLIEVHLRYPRTVAWYAESLMVSVRTLHRACMAAVGQTPKQMIDDRRMLEARRLLGHTDDTVAGVSRELGFPDAGSFARFFRRRTSMTAGAFRDAYRGDTTREAGR